MQILLYIEQQMREDEARLLSGHSRRRSADQYVDSMKMQLMFGIMVKAMQFLKLADTGRIPVVRTGLNDLLKRWGAFPHIDKGRCEGCDGVPPSDTSPKLMVEHQPPPLESKVLKIRNIEINIDKIKVCFMLTSQQHVPCLLVR